MDPNRKPTGRGYFAMSAQSPHSAEDLLVLNAIDAHKALLKVKKEAKRALLEAEKAVDTAKESHKAIATALQTAEFIGEAGLPLETFVSNLRSTAGSTVDAAKNMVVSAKAYLSSVERIVDEATQKGKALHTEYAYFKDYSDSDSISSDDD